jgi:hypothetical protein
MRSSISLRAGSRGIAEQRSPRHFRASVESLEGRQLLSADVLTYHNDNARTGADLSETVLSPATVSPTTFGKLFSYPVDGAVFAQPLYASGVQIGKAHLNLVFVATDHGNIYAFNADTNLWKNAAPIWHTSFTNPAAGVTTVTGSEVGSSVIPELGIIGTPVIDRSTGTMYVVDMVKINAPSGPQIVQRLHALDISTGAEKFGGPVIIQAAVPGTGDGGTTVSFNPATQLQRSGLLLLNGVVYIGWASFDDNPVFYGWLIGYNASTLKQTAALNFAPNGQEASVWMSGGAPAADSSGNIYVSTGNGAFSASTGGPDYGDSVVRISTAAGGLTVADYFTPSNQAVLSQGDQDLGSGGVVLLPDQPGPNPHQLVTAGKEGKIYLINRDNLGQFHNGFDSVVRETPANQIGTVDPNEPGWLGSFDSPAFFNNTIYYAGVGDTLKAFSLLNTQSLGTPVSQSGNVFPYPGATPSISANGNFNGIVWGIEKGNNNAVLHAYAASNLAHELYNSQMAGSRDQLDKGVTFSVPTVADAKVFVGTQRALTVFGDLRTAYVNTRLSLRAEGLSQRQVTRTIAGSGNLVWIPTSRRVRLQLDQIAIRSELRRSPRPRAR